MNKQLLFLCLVGGLLFSTTSKSQINSQFSATSEVASTGSNLWTPTSASGLSVDVSNGWGILTNFNGTTYTPTDTRMIYVGSLSFGGTADKYIVSKEVSTNSGANSITGTSNVVVKLRIGSNDYIVNAESATGYSNTKNPINRYALPGTNSVLCLSRVKDMYFGSTFFPVGTNTAVARIQYMHIPTSSSSLNSYNIDFIKSYVDSATVFQAISDNVSSLNKANVSSAFNVDFNASTYLTGFTASPTAISLSANNESVIMQTTVGTPGLAFLQYQPAGTALFGGFLWNFQKSNALLVKLNKQQAVAANSNYQIKLTMTLPDATGKLTSYEYLTPFSGETYTSAVTQKVVDQTNDYYVTLDLSSLKCSTAGAPTYSALATQNYCQATKLQFLLTSGLAAGDIIAVDYLNTFASKVDADTYVNTISGIKEITTISNYISAPKFTVSSNNGALKINGMTVEQLVTVYNTAGEKVYSKTMKNQIINGLQKGLYIVKINNEVAKVIL
jgi:hypothetical protein